MPQRRLGWQPSRFLTDRAEAEHAFQLAERQGAAAWSASGYVEGDTGVQHVQVPPTLITLTR